MWVVPELWVEVHECHSSWLSQEEVVLLSKGLRVRLEDFDPLVVAVCSAGSAGPLELLPAVRGLALEDRFYQKTVAVGCLGPLKNYRFCFDSHCSRFDSVGICVKCLDVDC